MHEFSIAQNILEIVEDTIRQNDLIRVEKVELEIGELSGIEIMALETALECLLPGSIIEKAEIKIRRIKGLARCRNCNHEYSPDELISSCPKCYSFGPEIIQGKELRVKSISGE